MDDLVSPVVPRTSEYSRLAPVREEVNLTDGSFICFLLRLSQLFFLFSFAQGYAYWSS